MKDTITVILQYVLPPLIVGLFGWLAKSPRFTVLPDSWEAWIKRIDEQNITALIETADDFVDYTPEQRKVWVVSELQKIAKNKLGITLSTSIANGIVEFAYTKYKAITD